MKKVVKRPLEMEIFMSARYYSFPEYCRKNFGGKLYKTPLDAGMTCPNRDGTLGNRGCVFCGAGGSGDFAISYDGQRLTEKDLLYNKKGRPGDYIAYFQSYTNTYAPIPRLRYLFDRALSDPLFAGISIGTRPDCVGDEVLRLLAELNRAYPNKFIWVEFGLQTIHEDTARYIRRGYPLSVFDRSVLAMSEIGVPVTAHVIIGLPGENKARILETVRHLSALPISGVKLQLLHILKGTDLETDFERTRFHVLSLPEYADIIADCIANLRPDIVIHRLTGDGSRADLVSPLWSLDKRKVLNTINHELAVRNITQGSAL